jgi:alpha-L-rhamnosidase
MPTASAPRSVLRLLATRLLLPAVFGPLLAAQTSVDALHQQFQNPPDGASIMMRWWWFGPAVTKEQLAREMRFMKEGGIGGFEVQPVYAVALDDEERGIKNLPYMSKEFLDALRFTAEEAKRLGLRFDLTLGSGWPYGGPHIPVSQSSGALRIDRVPIPTNSRRITLPDLRAGEKLLAAFAVRAQRMDGEIGRGGRPGPPSYRAAPESVRRLTDFHDGALWIPQEVGSGQQVWFFVSSRTGKLVERSAVAADGFILDHYRRDALETHLREVGAPLLQALGRDHLPYAIFADSLEVDNSDWTPDLLEEFQKRRGYDLTPHLPALGADLGPSTRAFRRDWGKTLTELLHEEFLAPLRTWSHERGTKLRMQAYGVPPASLAANFYVDLPEGEGSDWESLTASRWASSGAHLFGREAASAESWTWLHSPVFRATPLDMKAEADRHFLQGITQFVGHGWPYTSAGIPYPGSHFYAAGVFNEKNPWWIVMPDVSRYLQRVSFLLRQGRPANDVALYLPTDDAWADMTPGSGNLIRMIAARLDSHVIPGILEAGFGFDAFDDESLEKVGRVDDGGLLLGGNRYRIVVLPGGETIPPVTLRNLEEFARRGGILVAANRLPDSAPGFRVSEADNSEVREIADRLFRGASARGMLVEDTSRLSAVLAAALTPDVTLSPAAPAVGFLHRGADGAEIYFMANTANTAASTTASFRVPDERLRPQWWNPMSGDRTAAQIAGRAGGRASIKLHLEPYGSRVLVFSRDDLPAPSAPAAVPTGETLDISSGWRVTFGPGGKVEQMATLRSWTDEEDTRYFSGVATYEREVDVPARLLANGAAVRLDFGEGEVVAESAMGSAGMRAWLEGPIREAAVIHVNGQRAGSVWSPPYALDVTALLRPGRNRIHIEVANLAINNKAGQPLPNHRLLNQLYGERFTDQDMDKISPQPAGILGPVRLIAGGVRQ